MPSPSCLSPGSGRCEGGPSPCASRADQIPLPVLAEHGFAMTRGGARGGGIDTRATFPCGSPHPARHAKRASPPSPSRGGYTPALSHFQDAAPAPLMQTGPLQGVIAHDVMGVEIVSRETMQVQPPPGAASLPTSEVSGRQRHAAASFMRLPGRSNVWGEKWGHPTGGVRAGLLPSAPDQVVGLYDPV